MKANYLLRSRSKNSYVTRALALVTIFIVGALIFKFFDSAIIATAAPIWKGENVFSRTLGNTVSFFSSRNSLIQENTMLKDRLASLEIKLASTPDWQAQESTITDLLGRKHTPQEVIAAVLTHPPQTPYDVLVIDAGSDEALHVGAEVSLPEGPILGHVSEVFSNSAKVTLLSATDEETNAVLERHSVPVVLIGKGGGNFLLKIPRDVEVMGGDRILSTDITGRLLAVVENITLEPTDSFKEVLARSPANIFSVRFVFVLP